MFLCIGLCCSMLSFAEDKNLDLVQGDIEITPQGYSQGGNSESGSFTYVITSSTPTSNSLTIEGGGNSTNMLVVKLSDVDIDKDLTTDNRETCGAPVKISKGHVTLVIEGETTLKSISAFPGLALESDAYLTIEGDGVLKAYGSEKDSGSTYTYRCGAGIGPDETENLEVPNGHLVINSGSVYGYSVGGGYGFGSGAGNVYNGNISGGTLTINGGSAHFFGGYHPYSKYITEGIGTRNSGVELYINGGELEATIEHGTKPFVDGVQATRHEMTGQSPYYTAVLPGMLNQQKCGVLANFYGDMYYWTLEGQTFDDFLDGRVLLQASNNYNDLSVRVSGLGLFMPGQETELCANFQNSEVIFDHWSFGSTENPVKYTVTKSETIGLFLKPNPQRLWSMSPISDKAGECYVRSFRGGMYFDLDTVEIPETFEINGDTYVVTEIGSAADGVYFDSERTVPTTLVIPQTIRKVPANLFAEIHSMMSPEMTSFKKVICHAVVPPALHSGEGFNDIPEDGELVVPALALDSYKNDPVWGKAFSTFSTIEGYEYVTIDVSEGDVKITEEGYTVGDTFTPCSGPYILTTSSTTTNALEIVGGSKDNPLLIAVDNLNIDLSEVRRDNGQNNNGMNIVSGYVNMILIGENNICGGHDSAGIWLPAESTLRISGDGKLVAKAGSTKTGSWIAGAGIGGAVSSTSVGTLIIDSGSVYGYGVLGGAGFGSGSVWSYTDTFSENHGVLIMNGGDAHFFGSSDNKGGNTIGIPEGVGCAGNVPTLVYLNGGTLEATLKEGTPTITNGLEYHQHIQSGLSPNKEYVLTNHLGQEEYTATTDKHGHLFYWLTEGQTRKDVTGYDYVVEVYIEKDGLGSVTGADFYNDGDEAEIAFAWNSGNQDFKCWDNGETENPYRFTVTEDVNLTALLEPSELRAWRTEKVRDSETWTESETECAVESFDGSGFDITELEVPSSFVIDGKDYITTKVGSMEGRFTVDLSYALDNFIMPATITGVSSYLGWVNTAVFTSLATTPPSIMKDLFRPEEGEAGFWEVDENAVLRVPFGTSAAYKAAAGWKQFKNIEEMRPADEQWIIDLHSDSEAHILAYAHPEGFSSDILEIPSTVEKDGEIYVVTSIGHPETGEISLQIDYEPSTLVIHDAVTQVSPYLFGRGQARSANGLDNLSYVMCNAMVPPVLINVEGLNSFSNVPANAALIVPHGTQALYQAAPGWKEFDVRENVTTGIIPVQDNQSSEIEYYHIDGTRATSLTPGLYIVRQGNSTRKVIID